jgi:hypothetical protein
MRKPGRQRHPGLFVFLLAVSFAGVFCAPARAFFFPPLTPSVSTPSTPSTPTPIVVPALPPQVVPTTPLPPTTTPVTTPTNSNPVPDTAPEPTSLITALLGSAGLGLFAVYRRYRPRGWADWNVRGGCEGGFRPKYVP